MLGTLHKDMELIELRNPTVAPVVNTERGHIPESELMITSHWSEDKTSLVCAVEYRLISEGKDSPHVRRDAYVHLKQGMGLGASLAKLG